MGDKMLIAFEGIDGCGKTTIVNRLYDELLKEGYKVRKLKFPTNNNMFGQSIQVWLNWKGDFLHPFAMQLLFALDKYCHLEELQTKDDEIILLDRYTLSALAYGAFDLEKIKGKEADMGDLLNLKAINSYLPSPNFIYYIKADPKICIQRKTSQTNALQCYEELESLGKILYYYAKALDYLLIYERKEIRKFDGNLDIDSLYAQVKKQVLKDIKGKVRT